MGLDNPLHIAFLVVILLLVFGAKRLPEIGRSLGSGMREFKDSITGEAQQPTLTQPPSCQQPRTARSPSPRRRPSSPAPALAAPTAAQAARRRPSPPSRLRRC